MEGPKITRTMSCERKFESPKSIVTTKTRITTQVKMMWYLHSCYTPRRCFSGQTPDSAHTSVDTTCHLHCELLPELQSVDSRVTAAVPTRQHVSANEQHVLDSSSSSSRRVNQARTRLLPYASTSRKTDFHINSLFDAAAYLNHFGYGADLFGISPPPPTHEEFLVGKLGVWRLSPEQFKKWCLL